VRNDPFENLIKVGYWYSQYEPHLPMPTPMDGDQNPEYRQRIVEYLKAGKTLHAYRGSSSCRVCDLRVNGSKDFTDGTYVWPQGLAHYVEEHNTKLPDDFVEHILGFKLHRWGYKRCPRCDAISGDDWSQCRGRCPLEGSPHYDPNWIKGDITEYQSRCGYDGDHGDIHEWPSDKKHKGAFCSEPDLSDDIAF